MRNRFGISAEFAGDGARVCREVIAGDDVVLAMERFTTWGVPCSGGQRFPALSVRGFSLIMR